MVAVGVVFTATMHNDVEWVTCMVSSCFSGSRKDSQKTELHKACYIQDNRIPRSAHWCLVDSHDKRAQTCSFILRSMPLISRCSSFLKSSFIWCTINTILHEHHAAHLKWHDWIANTVRCASICEWSLTGDSFVHVRNMHTLQSSGSPAYPENSAEIQMWC